MQLAADGGQITLSAFAWGGVWYQTLAAAFTHPACRAKATQPGATAVVLGSSIGFEAYFAALTFNLPDTVSEKQHQVLRSLPLWLREHLSCALCRSHIHEHLIELGIPDKRSGREWAGFYWKAHNYVNEQSEVTRCGSQSCGWGTWSTPPAYRCAGVYRNAWFLTFADAAAQWRSCLETC